MVGRGPLAVLAHFQAASLSACLNARQASLGAGHGSRQGDFLPWSLTLQKRQRRRRCDVSGISH
ncbi:hypothetical protein FKP32DRAFT_1595174 [Trametes sanguinea]|nr:hypothetical protein FKP32DRAFT_1595174 [Trametes sanguinea]